MKTPENPRRTRFSWRIATLPVLLALAAGHLAGQARPNSEPLETCERITAAFREFHGQAFPNAKWTCDAGELHSIKGQRVDLITREEYEDFDLELDWKVTVGANSGIMYGVTEAGTDTYWSGPEMQINDDPHHPDGLEPKTSAGALYDLIAPNNQKQLKPTGEYNHARIVSRAGHIEHWLNGAKILEYDWDSPALRALIGRTKFATAPLFMKSRKGHIALQSEGDEVWFRHIRIRRLSDNPVQAKTASTQPKPKP
jgi:hypothetical protein